ncbi:MAG TPA: hypothetical protein DIU41_07690 [Oscillibacter sp.]|jgi:hypothetical protein|nr:MAG TPA: hypothetical protein [Caudoviricetes sp.]HCQ51970.1 hypothetical protein [Oscillibacter sp.]
MKRLTNEEVRVDESVDRYLGPLADLEGMKPKLLDLILNGPVLNGVSKDVLRQIIRQLYSALAAYEDTGMTPESVEALKLSMMGKAIAEIKEFNGLPVDRLRELAEADKDGRLVVLPCKVGDTVYLIVTKRARNYTPEFRFVKKSRLTFLNMERILQDFGKEAFLTREEAEKTLEAMK